LEGLSESLRRELMLFGIDVIIVAPGSVATPIWDKAEKLDFAQYDNTPYMKPLATVKDFMLGLGRKGFPPEKLGEAVATALTTSRPKTRYQVSPQPFLDFLQVALPKRLVDRVVARQVGLKKL
jgi:hypothetical protein